MSTELPEGYPAQEKAGAPPGSLIHVGEQFEEHPTIRLLTYSPDGCEEKEIKSWRSSALNEKEGQIAWLNVDGLHDVELIQEIGTHYGLHPLLIEDVLNTTHRPKVEEYEGLVFFTMKMLTGGGGNFTVEQISIVLGKDFLLTFQEKNGDTFDPVRKRIRSGAGNLRKRGTDFLAYRLVDTIVDEYLVTVEDYGKKVEELEDVVLQGGDEGILLDIQRMKRELIYIRRAILPVRDAVGSLKRESSDLIAERTTVFFSDVHDHCLHISDMLETYREVLAGQVDLYNSTVSNRMNKVMKVLTIMATIFIPLTFIAGIYGMNFKYMPELEHPWAYPAALALMGLTAGGMVWYFKRQKWF